MSHNHNDYMPPHVTTIINMQDYHRGGNFELLTMTCMHTHTWCVCVCVSWEYPCIWLSMDHRCLIRTTQIICHIDRCLYQSHKMSTGS